MFADMELVGIPHRLTIGDRGLDRSAIEYRHRARGEERDIPLDQVVQFLVETQQSLLEMPHDSSWTALEAIVKSQLSPTYASLVDIHAANNPFIFCQRCKIATACGGSRDLQL